MASAFSGAGILSGGLRTANGQPGILWDFNNVPNLTISLSPNATTLNSARDTARPEIHRMTTATSGSIEITCNEVSKETWKLFMGGRMDSVAGGATIATTPFAGGATTAKVGNVLKMGELNNVTAVVISDSTSGTPKTLTANVNYELDDFNGSIRLLDLTTGGPFVQPLKYSCVKGAVDVIAGLAAPDQELWLNLAGTNADDAARFSLDCYRVRFSTSENLKFLDSAYQEFTLKGSIMVDASRPNVGVGGQFFRLTTLTTTN